VFLHESLRVARSFLLRNVVVERCDLSFLFVLAIATSAITETNDGITTPYLVANTATTVLAATRQFLHQMRGLEKVWIDRLRRKYGQRFCWNPKLDASAKRKRR